LYIYAIDTEFLFFILAPPATQLMYAPPQPIVYASSPSAPWPPTSWTLPQDSAPTYSSTPFAAARLPLRELPVDYPYPSTNSYGAPPAPAPPLRTTTRFQYAYGAPDPRWGS
jgi:hypothetical protein